MFESEAQRRKDKLLLLEETTAAGGGRRRREMMDRLTCDICGRRENPFPQSTSSPGELQDDDMIQVHVRTDKSMWWGNEPIPQRCADCGKDVGGIEGLAAEIEYTVYPVTPAGHHLVCADCVKSYENIKAICVACDANWEPNKKRREE